MNVLCLCHYWKGHFCDAFDPCSDGLSRQYGADPLWGSGENNVSLLESKDSADEADEVGDGEHHVGRAASLLQLAVHLKPEPRITHRETIPVEETTDGDKRCRNPWQRSRGGPSS